MKEKLQKIRENAIAQIENSDGLAFSIFFPASLTSFSIAAYLGSGEVSGIIASSGILPSTDPADSGSFSTPMFSCTTLFHGITSQPPIFFTHATILVLVRSNPQ